jgi:A nuclease family of the HNH/ENDO VII superfamily with conserved AHH
MPEIGELIAFMVNLDKTEKCNFKPDQTKWNANLEGSSTALAVSLGNKPHANTESELTSSKWPSQAHHLIPHLTLIAHSVADWLKKDRRIYQDTKYNVDHKNNGKWMPYASSLPEWATGTETQKRALMFKIMGLAKIQMHQGKHSSSNTYGIAIRPYKARVKDYLDAIKNHAVSHYAGANPCADCKGNKKANKYPPTENTVRYVDKASSLLEKDINACRIFVSRIAAEFALAGGFK